MPIGECISHMALNTATEDALLELYTILSRAGVQLYLFDDVIAFIEWHVSTTFQKGSIAMGSSGFSLYSIRWESSRVGESLCKQ
jgi:hypothetical protein